MLANTYIIIDFDSAFVQVESLDELAKIALRGRKNRRQIIAKIQQITQMGMEGKLPFNMSLERRLKLLHANKTHLTKLISLLKKKITPSINRNREFFNLYADKIYIISGGFQEFIIPVVADFAIKENHVLANSFIFDQRGKIIGYDQTNPLANRQGKVKKLEALNLKGQLIIIGDGFTDYEIKAASKADKFLALTENVYRQSVVDKADRILPNFDEFLYIYKLPRAYSYPKNRIKVLLLENIHQQATDLFLKEGFQVESLSNTLSETSLAEKLRRISILGIRSRTQLTKKVLKLAKHLLCVGAFCIGTDQIDLSSCMQKGVVVFNAPHSNSRSVVELVLGEIIMLLRGITDKNKAMHQGQWLKSAENSSEVRGKKLGIIGYGNIGSQLSIVAEALGMEVYFYDLVDKLAFGNAHKCSSLVELLNLAEIVTIHVDGRQENTRLIGEKQFRLMKDGVYFLNLSRGQIVDIASLVKYLHSGKVRGAAIDVFPDEPKSSLVKFQSELQGLANVILTPHIAGSTQEAQQNIASFVAQKILDYINTGTTGMSVNFPNVTLPEQQHTHRFIHIHKNIPGVLAEINGILGERHINILGQYLNTNQMIGYVITDVNKKYPTQVVDQLKQVTGTIRFRVLY